MVETDAVARPSSQLAAVLLRVDAVIVTLVLTSTSVHARHPAATPPMGFNHCNVGCGKGEWNASAQMAMADAMLST